mgnify:CR=1 FL=1
MISGKHRKYKPMVSIVYCANAYHLFCIPPRTEDTEALFACKESFPIRINNIRLYRALYFFDYTPNSRFNDTNYYIAAFPLCYLFGKLQDFIHIIAL